MNLFRAMTEAVRRARDEWGPGRCPRCRGSGDDPEQTVCTYHAGTVREAPSRAPRARTAPVGRPSGAPKKNAEPWRTAKDRRVERGLEVTSRTPAYVLAEAKRLREMEGRLQGGSFEGAAADAAKARLVLLKKRITLYERCMKDEPGHRVLPGVLKRKRRSVTELRTQAENIASRKDQVPTRGK